MASRGCLSRDPSSPRFFEGMKAGGRFGVFARPAFPSPNALPLDGSHGQRLVDVGLLRREERPTDRKALSVTKRHPGHRT
jgi:hypothetical protein